MGAIIVQVLSKNLLEANELLKTHQTQLQAVNEKLKAVEDEKSALADKLTVAEREVTLRDTTMLQLKTEAHTLHQVLLLFFVFVAGGPPGCCS